MFRGKKYKKIAESFDRNQAYDLKAAIEILKKSELKFDQTVEIHFNLGVDPKHSDQVVRGTVVLPHGTGRSVRVLVFCKDNNLEVAKNAGADYAGGADLVQKIQEGWLDFDAVVATPDMMPVISKVARVLGPRGMMPSPKAGTVTVNVAQTVKELKAGKISYRVDKGANVHAPVGKLSFTVDQLAENAKSVIDSVVKNKPQTSKGTYIKSLTLTATMAPGIKLDMALTR
ncbi:MAG: 50S ribosomal protein L1 [Fibrobacter sp.]|jgi:large subunit ribosomal protein L1|uniref:50S ribosomal protein L1 n=1 Tax=unclassified Fibrobacter TaxID=2634177 RepID=UPI0009139140|nr:MULTISPECIES: 50S ribosomal protein L1 [unclassified Fibrobacter]MBQ3720424.1 50S ribosomal protein L1 [Fibrobacter sp.]MBQ9224823.1 50S ribosomal protein L1 [Fibrobacter sp.]MBR2306553.1 50S ribosomal protein L1 [Fibrobacter sp.]MBR4007422.1 50S ribosomal protein L1 [Fibrobacter sp.]SHH52162.1 LSU ribosomal protein L1P [Fibrobacter sp. UWCM]